MPDGHRCPFPQRREVEVILDRMQQLTRLRIFGSLPDVRRRKSLTKRVLGLK